jgi:beta-glucosidase
VPELVGRSGLDLTAAEAILAQLTLEEKAELCTGDSAWTTASIPRVALPALRMADGPHGVRRTPETTTMAFAAHAATCFPTASCTSSSWDPDLLREMGRAIAREARSLAVDIVLGPGVNIKRSPLCGRNFEYFSEDPYLAGELAVAWVEGIQSGGVGASLKHFAVNNQETRRMSVSAEVDERTLREIYLPAFEAAVTRAQPWTVMCAYNRINGVYASQHRTLLNEILRGEWGFDGAVVSDWAAVHDRPAALAAGLDIEMPGPRPRRVAAVVAAVQNGDLAESDLDGAVLRIVRMALRSSSMAPGEAFDSEAHHALARRIAAQGIVLLKNREVLPLIDGGRIAVIGDAAKNPRFQGAGSSQMTPTSIDVPIDELARLLPNASLTFDEGYTEDGSDPALIEAAETSAAGADVAVIYLSLPESKESEGRDRSDIDLADQQVALINAVTSVQPRTVVVLMNGSALAMSAWIDNASAVVEAWFAGQAAGGAIADVLVGRVNPSGRLAETIPIRIEDTPAFLNFPGDGDVVRYGEGIYVGYRWYDKRHQPVLFPFGHGLSYTTFSYGPATLSAQRIPPTEGVTVSVTVTNTGTRPGSEVVQVYVRDVQSSLSRPERELKAFAKVFLAPGETQTASLRLDQRAFALWHPTHRRWVVEDGDFEIQVGSSSADIRVTALLTVEAGDVLEPMLTAMSPLGDWLKDRRGQIQADALLREIAPLVGLTFGNQPDADIVDLDAHFHDYFMAMPLRDVLEFAAAIGGPDPDERLAQLMDGLAPGTNPDKDQVRLVESASSRPLGASSRL